MHLVLAAVLGQLRDGHKLLLLVVVVVVVTMVKTPPLPAAILPLVLSCFLALWLKLFLERLSGWSLLPVLLVLVMLVWEAVVLLWGR
jgi:hypothetical protein